jgi:integrase
MGAALRLFARGVPVTPVNLALDERRARGATPASERAYVYALRLFLEFTAWRGLALIDVTDADFRVFTRALRGESYRDGDGVSRSLPHRGGRSATTIHNIIGRLYGLFGDIESDYHVTFDWRRYRAATRGAERRWLGGPGSASTAMTHGQGPVTREPLDLPDEQFAKALVRAEELWLDEIADGDRAYALNPEAQRGALFRRNVGLLFTMRFAGARRAEVPALDLSDIDRPRSRIALVTKGRQGERESVVLAPVLADALARYILEFRPFSSTTVGTSTDEHAVFVSHSVKNYGRRISAETVRLVTDQLAPALDPPWRERLTPHLLRHAFAYSIQRVAGPVALSANLRHRSIRSADAYRGAAALWAADLIRMSEASAEIFRSSGIDL